MFVITANKIAVLSSKLNCRKRIAYVAANRRRLGVRGCTDYTGCTNEYRLDNDSTEYRLLNTCLQYISSISIG